MYSVHLPLVLYSREGSYVTTHPPVIMKSLKPHFSWYIALQLLCFLYLLSNSFGGMS